MAHQLNSQVGEELHETSESPAAPPQRPAPDPTAVIEPDSTAQSDATDTDSAIGDDPSVHSTSITSSILNYTYENGRRYHAFRSGSYLLPNDEPEQDRLDLLHHVWRLVLQGDLHRAPLRSDLRRVLDFGTGTGIWAMDFADEYPKANITGTDLSPIQPEWVPPNVTFYVDDVESPWLFHPDEAFDFIHGRGMVGSITDWSKLFHNIFTHLTPGGWVEVQDYEAWITSDDGSDALAPNFRKLRDLVGEASATFGKNTNIVNDLAQDMRDSGFVSVQDDIHKVPIGQWPRDPKLKEIGKYSREASVSTVEPFCLGYVHKVLG